VVDADLEHRAVEIELDGHGGGTLTAAVAVPWSGLRIELGSRTFRRSGRVRFGLSDDDYRALTAARSDGARVEVTLDGSERQMVHLDGR
jgi:hypothetical protein